MHFAAQVGLTLVEDADWIKSFDNAKFNLTKHMFNCVWRARNQG
ncbi:MAG: hypothetical protein U5J99_04940 [Parvularculaceae bacterium]|nr:hypothetical protein [Parvularculaceae bacterium]